MKTIKFSHNYPKLHNQTQGKLLAVDTVARRKLSEEFIDYDTTIDEKNKYTLPKEGYLILLVFQGDKNIPFTTARSWNYEKELYYRHSVGCYFNLEINNK